jgi:hypothetical protein
MGVVTTVSVATISKVLTKVADDLYESGKSKFQTKKAQWINQFKVKSLAAQAIKVTKVRTLINSEEPEFIENFYYPSKIQFSPSLIKKIDSLKGFPQPFNYVIQGTAGQGKSIFLRYLFTRELRQETTTGRIPIFVELKKSK